MNHTLWSHVMSCHCHVMSCHVMSCHGVQSCPLTKLADVGLLLLYSDDDSDVIWLRDNTDGISKHTLSPYNADCGNYTSTWFPVPVPYEYEI